MASVTAQRIVKRPRAFIRVAGPDAENFLQRMLSNDVTQSCDALLLTPKARIIAPVHVFRHSNEDFLLSTEPELGDVLRVTLLRARFASKVQIEPEEHDSWLVVAVDGGEVVDERPGGEEVGEEEYERWRIEHGIPRWGAEIDSTILPAEAGLDKTHINFTKGCYPGQEPIARQHYRGKVNRRLRILDVDEARPGEEILHGEKVVGRVTSAVAGRALAYVRTDVPEDAELRIDGRPARLH